MAESKKDTLKGKKKELEAELKSIQDELDDSLNRVKTDVSGSLDPLNYVRRHPLPMVGVSLFVGFLAGKEGGKKKNKTSPSNSDSSDHKLTSTLWYEMKRLAARKVLSMASDYIDGFFAGD